MYGFGYGTVLGSGITGGESVAFAPESIALFDSYTGEDAIPEYWKAPTDALIKTLINEGVWANPDFKLLLYVPTLDRYRTVIDIKSLQSPALWYDNGSINNNESHAGSFPTVDGWATYGSFRLRTGIIPSAHSTPNDRCIVISTYDDETGNATSDYNWGSFNSGGQFMGSTHINTQGNFRTAAYTTSAVNGTAQGVGDGLASIRMSNRTSTALQAIQDNNIIAELANPIGSAPTNEIWLNTFNLNGAPSRYIGTTRYDVFGELGEGLTLSKRTNIMSAFMQRQNALKIKKSLKTKQVVWDGNSFNAFHQAALQRKFQHLLRQDSSEWHFESPAISGKETREMISDFQADVADKYDASYSENIYIFCENSNDFWKNYNSDVPDAVAATKANHDTLIGIAKAAGFTVICLGGNARTAGASGYTQQEMNLGLSEIQNYERDQAIIQGYTFITPSVNRMVYRQDYASDALYNAAMTGVFTNGTYFMGDQTHQNEAESFAWGQQVYDIFNTLI